jgi:branched-chain amino acid transport system ATP-binding protein
MLLISDLSILYGRVQALESFSLNLNAGSLAAVVGPNGAGKSSLLMAIAGVVRPSKGSITYKGVDITGRKPEMVVSHGVVLATEQRRLFKTLTVEDNLRLTAGTKREAAYVSSFERFPQLRPLRHTRAEALSGGEQQQLALARALLLNPSLLLLDEPSLGLAPRIVDQLFEVIDEMRRSGITILLVEQHARRAIAIADQVAVLAAGRTVSVTAADAVPNLGDVESAYFGDHA